MPRRHRIHAERVYVVRVNIWHRWYRRFAVLLFILSLPVAAYYGAQWYLGGTQRVLSDQNLDLQTRLSILRTDLDLTEQENANLLIAALLDDEAEQHLQNELVNWRERNELLQSEIQFYLSLMEPSISSQGVFIQSAELVAMAESGSYRYSLVIGQKSQDHPRVTGAVRLQVISENENQYTNLGLADLTDGGAELALGFIFFQQMDGIIYLSADFKPTEWMVEVDLASANSGSITETYDWPFPASR